MAQHALAAASPTQNIMELDSRPAAAQLKATITKIRDSYIGGRQAFNKISKEWWIEKTQRAISSRGAAFGGWSPLSAKYIEQKRSKGLPTGVWVRTGQTRTALMGGGLRVTGGQWAMRLGLPAYRKLDGSSWYNRKHMTVHPWFFANYFRTIQKAAIPVSDMVDLDRRLQVKMNEIDAKLNENVAGGGI